MVISIAADITEHIKDLNLIQEQKEQLEAIINSMSDGIIISEKDTKKFTLLNKTARDFFSSSEKVSKTGELINFDKCFYDGGGKEVSFEDSPGFRVFNKGKYNDYRLTIVHPDKKMYVSVNGSPIYDKDGEVKRAVLCIRDMTRYVKKEIELEESRLRLLNAELERNKALERAIEMKDEFLSLISHELRTPLNVITTAIQAMKYIYRDEMSDKVREYMNIIRQNAFRQLRLVNNLLDITRANAGRIKIKKKNIDIVFLTRSITESVNAYASRKGINIIFTSLLSEKIIGIDDEKYERILLNLLSNAIKFTPEGKHIEVKLSSKKKNIRIEITDYGIGIPEDKLALIFERFGQVDSSLSRQAEGSGIGLSLVKKFVEALRGSISVKSKVNEGSTFTILFPGEILKEENSETEMTWLLDNHIIETMNVEFSDIYM
jgi:signal transduction histidine kinase